MDSRPIGAVDALFIDLERPTTLNILASLSIHDPSTAPDGLVRHRDILSYLDGRLHIARQWRQKLIFNPLQLEEPRLVDDPNFDLEFHVRHIALPHPHDERQLKILTARIVSRPMDTSRPLWEMYVIEGLSNCKSFPPDSFAILLKMHHAVFDGEAGIKAQEAIYTRTPDEVAPAPTKPWSPEPAPGLIDWVTGSTTHAFRRVAETLTTAPEIAKSAWAEGQTIVTSLLDRSENEAVPTTRFQAPVTSHRVFDWLTIPIDRFIAVREALGRPKINDLMLAIVGGGLRRYLAGHDELPEETLVALCPINIRAKDATEIAGNQVALMRLPLGTTIADPIARMKRIAAVSAEKKSHVSKTGGTLAADVLGMVPYPVRTFVVKNLASLMAAGKMKPMLNTVVTNVPSPPGDFYFAGARVITRVGLAPLFSHIGLTNIVSTSSVDAMFAATSCREIMPDIAHYMECISESFGEIEEIALGRTSAPSVKR